MNATETMLVNEKTLDNMVMMTISNFLNKKEDYSKSLLQVSFTCRSYV